MIGNSIRKSNSKLSNYQYQPLMQMHGFSGDPLSVYPTCLFTPNISEKEKSFWGMSCR